MSDSLDYIRHHYGVPADQYRRVCIRGQNGSIVGGHGPHLKVLLDGKENAQYFHPQNDVTYLDMAPAPVSRWWCLAPWRDPATAEPDAWFEVLATTRSKARYQAYRQLEDVGVEAHQLLGITVRRERP